MNEIKKNESEIPKTNQKYQNYENQENEYDQYERTEEDDILWDMNTKYSKKGAYVALGLVTAGFSIAAIIMSQKWVPYRPIIIPTTATTTSTTSTTTPPADPDQVKLLVVFRKIVYTLTSLQML